MVKGKPHILITGKIFRDRGVLKIKKSFASIDPEGRMQKAIGVIKPFKFKGRRFRL